MANEKGVRAITVSGEANSCIEEITFKLNDDAILLMYNVDFLPDMDNSRIRKIIEKAAETARGMALTYRLTEGSVIAFTSKFWWLENDDVFTNVQAKDLAKRMMEQGWAGLVSLPWVCWNVRCAWQLAKDLTFPGREPFAVMSGIPFLMATGSRVLLVHFGDSGPTEVANAAVNLFGQLYPDCLLQPLG